MKLNLILLLSLIIFTLTSTGFYYFYFQNPSIREKNENFDEDKSEDTVNNRNFFKQWQKQEHYLENSQKLRTTQENIVYPQILTYGLDMLIDISTSAEKENVEELEKKQRLTAQCDIQTIYDKETDLFEVAVSYSMVDKHDDYEDNEDSFDAPNNIEDNYDENYQFEEEQEIYDEEQRQDYFYLVYVKSSSGKVEKLMIESGYEEDEFLTYATQQLINDIFPELRKSSFEKGVIESDNLGNVEVDYTKESIDNQNFIITKEYNSNDYKSYKVPELEHLETSLLRNTLVDQESGIVKEGETQYNFTMGDVNDEENIQNLKSTENNVESDIEILGQLDGQLNSQFWLVEESEIDENLASEMFRYRNEAEFEEVRLANQKKAEIQYGNGQEENIELVDIDEDDQIEIIEDDQLLNTEKSNIFYDEQNTQTPNKDVNQQQQQQQKLSSKGGIIFQEQKELGGAKVLGKRIAIDLYYTGYEKSQDISLRVRVGSHNIATILQQQFDNCPVSVVDKYDNSINLTFFSATFPFLGIVTIPVRAGGRISYGYNINISEQIGGCALNLNTYAVASVYAEGKISLAGLISAGVYAQGNFLDTNLKFSISQKKLSLDISLTGNFKAVGFEVGLIYSRFNCSLKNLKSDGLEESSEIPKLQKFKFKNPIRKIARVVKKVVHVVKKVVKGVAKVVRKIGKVVMNLHKICKKSKGFKKLAGSSTPPKQITIFQKSWNNDTVQYIDNQYLDFSPLYIGFDGQDHVLSSDHQQFQQLLSQGFTNQGIIGYVLEHQIEGTVQLDEFYNQQYNNHFYTCSEAEKQALVTHYGYQQTKIMGYVHSSLQPNTQPIYRLNNQKLVDHYFTNSEELQEIAQLDQGYKYEGIQFYAFNEEIALNGQKNIDLIHLDEDVQLVDDQYYDFTPFYRILIENIEHYFTTNQLEYDRLINQPGYQDQGYLGYVLENNVAGSVSLYSYYNHKNGKHFYTAKEQEKLIYQQLEYEYLGIVGYVFLEKKENTIAVYKSYNPHNNDQFFTISAQQYQNIQSNSYDAQGIDFYIYSKEYVENGTSVVSTDLIIDTMKDGKLIQNEILYEGMILSSQHGYYHLSMQSDGNLVLYQYLGTKKDVVWHTHTHGKGIGPYHAKLLSNGNFAVYDNNHSILWQTNTYNQGQAPYRFELQHNRNLAILDVNNKVIYQAGTYIIRYALRSGESLFSGMEVHSLNGRFKLVMQYDGNFVHYYNGSTYAIWHSHTPRGWGIYQAQLYDDGNLALLDSNQNIYWQTRRHGWGQAPYNLIVQDDRNLVQYDHRGRVIFATDTHFR